MREKLVSIGDDYWIEDEAGRRAFKVDGKALRVRETLVFEDDQGRELAKIQEKLVRVRDTTVIEGPSGETLATVKKALISPLRDRFTVELPGAENMEVQGNIVDHEYRIEQGRQKIAEISRRWFRIRDTYGVEIEPGQPEVLILAVTAAIDQMTDRG
jgi:uncharacterized protein YxjI